MNTEIEKILEIPAECPADFYKNPIYLESVTTAIETAKSLVHSIDDEGKKKAASDAAAIRKYVKSTNGFTKTVFDSLTGKVKTWRDTFTVKTKELDNIADDIMFKFSDLEKQKILHTEEMLMAALGAARDKAGIEDTFITRPEFKVTLAGWITPGGLLTKKSTDLVASIVSAELEQQTRYHNRCNVVKIHCLESDINPAFDPDVLGDAMFAISEDVFLFKLESLIGLEHARIEKQNEKIEDDKKAAVEKALKEQQAEADRIARQTANDELAKQAEANKKAYAEKRQHQEELIEQANNERRKQELKDNTGTDTPSGTRIATYTIVFQAKVKANTTNEQFMEMIKKEVNCTGKALKAIISETVS